MSAPRIVGIDPGVKFIDWVVYQEGQPIYEHDFGKRGIKTRLLMPALFETDQDGRPVDLVAIEDFTFMGDISRRSTNGYDVCRNIGRLVGECASRGIECVLIKRQTVKAVLRVRQVKGMNREATDRATRAAVQLFAPNIGTDFTNTKFCRDKVAALAVAIAGASQMKTRKVLSTAK